MKLARTWSTLQMWTTWSLLPARIHMPGLSRRAVDGKPFPNSDRRPMPRMGRCSGGVDYVDDFPLIPM